VYTQGTTLLVVALSLLLLCRQQSQGLLPAGTAFDLFRGTAASVRDEVEAYPTQLAGKVTFGAKTHPEVRLASTIGGTMIDGVCLTSSLACLCCMLNVFFGSVCYT
jgi:hypothetical protein